METVSGERNGDEEQQLGYFVWGDYKEKWQCLRQGVGKANDNYMKFGGGGGEAGTVMSRKWEWDPGQVMIALSVQPGRQHYYQ